MKATYIFALVATAVAGSAYLGSALAADFGSRQPLPPIVYVEPAPPPVAYVPAPPIAYAAVNPHCMRWTDICDRRWGFGSPRFARCMWRHDC